MTKNVLPKVSCLQMRVSFCLSKQYFCFQRPSSANILPLKHLGHQAPALKGALPLVLATAARSLKIFQPKISILGLSVKRLRQVRIFTSTTYSGSPPPLL